MVGPLQLGRREPGQHRHLTLDGTKILTNFEQYMGSNTRTFTPNMVNEARFGYTRFYNSIGTFLAFTQRCRRARSAFPA